MTIDSRTDTGFKRHIAVPVDNEGDFPEGFAHARWTIGKNYQEKWIYVKGLNYEKDWMYVCGK